MPRRTQNPLFDVLRSRRQRFDPAEVACLFKRVDATRVDALAGQLAAYIGTNLPRAFERRAGLADFRTSPYVLMTSASVMGLGDPARFAEFLFNSKLYMALETSFGKSIEAALVGPYPIGSTQGWADVPEKLAESAALEGLSREEKARRRVASVWREIDRACVVGRRRYLVSMKSGPNTINDTQVQAMTQAIIDHHGRWVRASKREGGEVRQVDVVLGLTYGTDRTTNNKENQVLAKLLDHGFVEEDRVRCPGVLCDRRTRSVRVYRRIGRDFWAFIGRPDDPGAAEFVFLEVLIGLAKALSSGLKSASIETRINQRLQALAKALCNVHFPRQSLPGWVRRDFTDDELFWFATALSAFYDEGI